MTAEPPGAREILHQLRAIVDGGDPLPFFSAACATLHRCQSNGRLSDGLRRQIAAELPRVDDIVAAALNGIVDRRRVREIVDAMQCLVAIWSDARDLPCLGPGILEEGRLQFRIAVNELDTLCARIELARGRADLIRPASAFGVLPAQLH